MKLAFERNDIQTKTTLLNVRFALCFDVYHTVKYIQTESKNEFINIWGEYKKTSTPIYTVLLYCVIHTKNKHHNNP